MDPESRRGTGSFYTPAALVDSVVGESLVRWLATQLGGSAPAAAAELARPSAEVLARIRGIAIVDPAVGSGAFLLGALRRLVAVRVAGGESRGSATRQVIATNLFGVDRNPNAVHLAELRLWLEVIEADADAEPDTIAPLPNLDALIRQGDSVLGRLDLPFAIRTTPHEDIGTLRAAVVGATGGGKRAAVAALRRGELRAARAALEAAITGLEAEIREVLSSGKSRSLFGERIPLSRLHRAALGRLRADRARLRVIRRRLVAAGELPWFHYGSHFNDVMGRGGFDLVVGNPPWVRAEALTGPEREALKRRYRWFKASPTGKPGFAPLPDLSVAFLERGFDLLAPDGILGFVLPAKLLTAQYGGVARGALARDHRIHLIRDLGDTDHGFDATVYPLVLVAGRGAPAADHAVIARGDRKVPQCALGSDPWDLGFAGPAEQRSTDAARRHPTIADRFRIRLGVKTGADPCFLDPPGSLEPRWIRPALRGRDITAFRVRPVRTLLWAHDESGAPVPSVPATVSAVLAPHLRRLALRSDQRGHPPWALFRTDAALGRHRVVWADLARELTAAALVSRAERSLVPLNTCYAILTGDARAALALSAWLNAGPIRRLAKRRATVAAAGFSRFNAELVGRLPCPAAVTTDERLIELARAGRRGALDQDGLDRRATELLDGG